MTDYTFVLANRAQEPLGVFLGSSIEEFTFNDNLNSANEASFVCYKEVDGIVDPLFEELISLRLIYIPELKQYYEADVSLDDEMVPRKTVTCTGLCEAELSQINLYDYQINSEEDIVQEDYVVTKFYDPENPRGSLLNRILEKAPHYTIGHVDDSLKNLQRTFQIDGDSIYDFLTGECAEQFHCLFQFDSMTRTISAYDLYTVCEDCGYRGDFENVCPKCGSTHIHYFGEDTTVFVDVENLTENIQFTTDKDSIKNAFKMETGDDLMTATVVALNPNGTDYIYYFDETTLTDMPAALRNRIQSYEELYDMYANDFDLTDESPIPDNLRHAIIYYNSNWHDGGETGTWSEGKSYRSETPVDSYEDIMNDVYAMIDDLQYYRSSMMPTIADDPETAETAASKLYYDGACALDGMALTTIKSNTSVYSVNSAIKNYAKAFINTGKFKVDVNEGATFVPTGTAVDGNYSTGVWTGSITVTNWSDTEDKAIVPPTGTMTINVNTQYDEFMQQKILVQISTGDTEGGIYDVLTIEELSDFEAAIKLYSLNRLTSFRDAIQTVLDTITETLQAGVPSTAQSAIEDMYDGYKAKLDALDAEITVRTATINAIQEQYDYAMRLQYGYVDEENPQASYVGIQDELNFQSYLGTELYRIFCAYRREDKYSNSNYTSDGLDNDELFEKAQEFLTAAQKEIKIAGTPQHSISTTLNNLLLIPEFEPIRDKFQLGNWIRVRADEKVYRLRLISYGISSASEENIDVEFSDLTVSPGTVTDMQSLLNQATSMSSTYLYVSQQSSAAKDELARLLAQERNERQVFYDQLQEQLNSSKGLYSTEERQEGGGTIYYYHDMPLLEESMLVWKFTEQAVAMSTDGGKTYPYMVTVDGNAIMNIIQANGLRANWIDAGKLEVKDPDTNVVVFSADFDTGVVQIGRKASLPPIGGANLLYNGAPEFTTEGNPMTLSFDTANGTFTYSYPSLEVGDPAAGITESGTYTYINDTLQLTNSAGTVFTGTGEPIILRYVYSGSDSVYGDFVIPVYRDPSTTTASNTNGTITFVYGDRYENTGEEGSVWILNGTYTYNNTYTVAREEGAESETVSVTESGIYTLQKPEDSDPTLVLTNNDGTTISTTYANTAFSFDYATLTEQESEISSAFVVDAHSFDFATYILPESTTFTIHPTAFTAYTVEDMVYSIKSDNDQYMDGTMLADGALTATISRIFAKDGKSENGNTVPYQEGKTYTFSMDIKADADVEVTVSAIAEYEEDGTQQSTSPEFLTDNPIAIAGNADWKTVYWTYIIPDDWDDAVGHFVEGVENGVTVIPLRLNIQRTSNSVDTHVQLRRLQIEYGEIVTDWRRAQSDYEAETSTVQTVVSEQIAATNSSVEDLQNKYAYIVNDSDAGSIISRVGALENTVDGIPQTIETSIQQTSEDITFLKTTVFGDDSSGESEPGLQERLNTIEQHVRIEGASIVVGRSDSPLSIQITNERITFFSSGTPVAYIQGDKLHIEKAVFLRSITIGNFGFTPRANGNLSFGIVPPETTEQEE